MNGRNYGEKSHVEQYEKQAAGCSGLRLTLMVGASVYAQSLQEVMQQRGLTENDLLAAAKTYHPSGLKDEYVVFSSGGQSGQVIV